MSTHMCFHREKKKYHVDTRSYLQLCTELSPLNVNSTSNRLNGYTTKRNKSDMEIFAYLLILSLIT